MGSPATGSSFNIVNLGGTACDALSKAIQVENVNKAFFTWAFTPDGSAITPEFAALFANYLQPVGAPFWWPLASVPANCVKADGRSLLRAHSSVGAMDGYPELFAVYGTTYGTEDSTHFSVPDLRELFLFGAGDNHPVGEEGGEETHKLIIAELPKFKTKTSFQNWDANGDNPDPNQPLLSKVFTQADTIMESAEVGGDVAHENMPPYRAGTMVIKAR